MDNKWTTNGQQMDNKWTQTRKIKNIKKGKKEKKKKVSPVQILIKVQNKCLENKFLRENNV